jgi:FAD/FMN-containing dehydrogenase
VINVCLFWKNAEDDEVVLQAQTNIIDKSVALAKQMGLHHPFIFQNYARYDQDVFAGYGLENRKRLQEIQKKYDPDGVFSRLQPGYFKV